jgi:hypothetical protein
MSNPNAPSGFKPVRHANGGIVRMNRYYIASGLASNIYRGDVIKPVNTNKRIDVAAAGDRLQGVFDGVMYQDANNDTFFRPRWPTGTTLKTGTVAECLVYDDPFTLFEVQGSGIVAEADIFTLGDLTAATAGNAATGQSGQQLDTTTLTSTIATGGQFKVMQFVDRPSNVRGAANARVLVKANEHYEFGSTTAGQAATTI